MRGKPEPFFRKQTKSWYVQIGKHQIFLGKTRSEAFLKYYQIIASTPSDSVQSCAELAFRFLQWLSVHRSGRTMEWYEYLLRKAMPVLARTTVSSFRPMHITEAEQLCAGFNQNSLHNLSRAIHAMFNWGCSQGYIEKSPVLNHRKPRAVPRDDMITESDYKIICALTKNIEFLRVVQFAWETGARPQEIFRIQVRHVDLEQNRIIFPPSEEKSKRSFRLIYLNDESSRVVRESIDGRKEGHLFLNSQGRPWNKDSIHCQFTRIKQHSGKKYHLGAFRKSFITDALKNGVDTVTLSHLVGHADLGMISKVYAKLQHDPEHMHACAIKARKP